MNAHRKNLLDHGRRPDRHLPAAIGERHNGTLVDQDLKVGRTSHGVTSKDQCRMALPGARHSNASASCAADAPSVDFLRWRNERGIALCSRPLVAGEVELFASTAARDLEVLVFEGRCHAVDFPTRNTVSSRNGPPC